MEEQSHTFYTILNHILSHFRIDLIFLYPPLGLRNDASLVASRDCSLLEQIRARRPCVNRLLITAESIKGIYKLEQFT